MHNKKSSNTVWEILAEYYPEDKYDKIDYYERYLSKYIKRNDVALDGGCGHISFKNNKTIDSKGFVLVGCDYGLSDIKNNKDIKFGVNCDLNQMPFKDNTFI